ncbi:transmembrane protein 79 [Bombina bombina]|uniref:transmembrane protein 79 n=1 Tax=Bombina bombina TaxID=8345 RepID=UPI00235B0845|nr:transmembrane protein 79 [Bombina bombina]
MEMHEMDIENGNHEARPLLNPTCTRSVDEESLYLKPQCCRFDRVCLKIVLSFIISVIILPPLMYGAYALLPFDVPVMPDVTTRLVYTLRCGVFASFPIVLGVIIQGISRLCTSYFDPFKPKVREVTIHQRFVKQGTFLFVLYIFNLAVLATYLPQDYLKLIPLLICLFVISQLIYWLSFAVGRPFRSFGYGMTFMPLVCMLACNLFFIFIVDPHKMVFLGKETNSEAKVKSSG